MRRRPLHAAVGKAAQRCDDDVAITGGTSGSNPLLSGGESANYQFRSARLVVPPMGGLRRTYGGDGGGIPGALDYSVGGATQAAVRVYGGPDSRDWRRAPATGADLEAVEAKIARLTERVEAAEEARRQAEAENAEAQRRNAELEAMIRSAHVETEPEDQAPGGG